MGRFERLGVQDRLHLDLEDAGTHMHVAGVLVFEAGPLQREDGGVDVDRIRAFLESRLFRVPRYRQCLETVPVEQHPVWVDDPSFNLQYHVRHTRLPLPGDERQLKRFVGRVVSQQLDRGKPLWELWLVEGLEDERIAVVMKVHHSMADGIASIDLLRALLTAEPTKSFEGPPAWLPQPRPDAGELLGDALRRRLSVPLRLAGGLGSLLRDPAAGLARVREGLASLDQARRAQAVPASETPLNEPIGPHRRFDWLGFDLDEVRRIRRSLGGTVNDVFLATVTGAIGDFFERRGITRPEQRDLDFRAACPVSTRGNGHHGLGNQVSSLIVPLPLGEADPVRRLALVSETTQGLKAMHQELAARIAQAVSEATWPGLYTTFARSMVDRRSANLVVSNVPGPRAPLYLLEARLLEAYPIVPLLPNQALGIACLSYAGGLYCGINSDWDRMPDLHDLVIAIDRSFHELCDAAAAAGGQAV
jgi:diacylglycerol O-acyltransferase